jgi:hypothetical protein
MNRLVAVALYTLRIHTVYRTLYSYNSMCGLANTLLSTIGIYRCYTLLVSFNNELMDIETEKETLLIAQDARC